MEGMVIAIIVMACIIIFMGIIIASTSSEATELRKYAEKHDHNAKEWRENASQWQTAYENYRGKGLEDIISKLRTNIEQVTESKAQFRERVAFLEGHYEFDKSRAEYSSYSEDDEEEEEDPA